jgi:hypothetical protein
MGRGVAPVATKGAAETVARNRRRVSFNRMSNPILSLIASALAINYPALLSIRLTQTV